MYHIGKKIIALGLTVCVLGASCPVNPVWASEIQNRYDASQDVEEALQKLASEDRKKAEVIEGAAISRNVFALTFTGLSDQATNRQIIQLLKDYDVQATFFVPGIKAAEDGETIAEISQSGNLVGSNTLDEETAMENMSQEDLVEDFCRTNRIIEYWTNRTPQLLYCNSTEYTDEVLEAAYASGNTKVVKSTSVINYSSFSSYEQVLEYMLSLAPGSILTIKMERELDETEYDEKISDEDPAKDMQAGLEENDLSQQDKAQRLAEVVEWILKAMEEIRLESVTPDRLQLYTTNSVGMLDIDVDLTGETEETASEDMGTVSEDDSREDADTAGAENSSKDADTAGAENVSEAAASEDAQAADGSEEENGTAETVEQTEPYTSIPNTIDGAALTFRGLQDEARLKEVLDFLKENQLTATFFVTTAELLEYPLQVQSIIDAGQIVANGGADQQDPSAKDANQLAADIERCDTLLQENFGVTTKLYMPAFGKWDAEVLEAANSLGYTVVTYNKNAILDENATVDEVMEYFSRGLSNGDIVTFRLDYYEKLTEVLDRVNQLFADSGLTAVSIEEMLANRIVEEAQEDSDDKEDTDSETQDSAKKTSGSVLGGSSGSSQKGSGSSASGGASGWSPQHDQSYLDRAELLRELNQGVKSSIVRSIYTTAGEVAYAFYGVSNTQALENVLNVLDALGIRGTFYISRQDIQNHPEMISRLAAEGHSLQIALLERDGTDYASIASTILEIQDYISQFGQQASYVRYPYQVEETDDLMEAVSATGCSMVYEGLAIANSSLGRDATVDQICDRIFNAGNLAAQRGEIIYCRLDYYTDASVVAQMVQTIKEQRIDTTESPAGNDAYKTVTLDELLNADQMYICPVDEDKIVDKIRDAVSEGHLDGLTDDQIMQIIKEAYIGTPTSASTSDLPGFTEEEIDELNNTGRFTNDKTLFLTFDDWGSDAAINKLLGVLKKYNVKATFFVRTNYVEDNPNLLRAIALDGHNIASHTDEHMALAGSINESEKTSLTEEEQAALQADIIESYEKLQSIVGDVTDENGDPVLTTFLRPPTLAVSKEGLEIVLDSGYTHIVSADFSTHDYEADSAQAIIDTFLNGIETGNGLIEIQNGSVIVLHMSDEAEYTAEALDYLIPYYLSQGYTFSKLSDYLVNGGEPGEMVQKEEQPEVSVQAATNGPEDPLEESALQEEESAEAETAENDATLEEVSGEAVQPGENPQDEELNKEEASEETIPAEEDSETPEEETAGAETPTADQPEEVSEADDSVSETSTEETPVAETPAEEAPAKETSEEEAPAEETPEEGTPAEETPAEETPVAETPEEAPAEETPTEETPVTEAPAAETPAAEAPAEEAPAAEAPTPAPAAPAETPAPAADTVSSGNAQAAAPEAPAPQMPDAVVPPVPVTGKTEEQDEE